MGLSGISSLSQSDSGPLLKHLLPGLQGATVFHGLRVTGLFKCRQREHCMGENIPVQHNLVQMYHRSTAQPTIVHELARADFSIDETLRAPTRIDFSSDMFISSKASNTVSGRFAAKKTDVVATEKTKHGMKECGRKRLPTLHVSYYEESIPLLSF